MSKRRAKAITIKTFDHIYVIFINGTVEQNNTGTAGVG